jgi:adenylyl-sulfate kinase
MPPGRILWLTGLSGAGKSTLAIGLEHALAKLGRKCVILDGDNIRRGLCSDLGFSPKDRKENIRRIGEVARLFSGAGIICVTAFISPYRSDREIVRRLVEPGIFVEIYVNAPLSVCEHRDPKGLYAKARAGEIRDFTGISAPYEPPINPEVEIQSDRMSPDECVGAVLRYLQL